MCFKSGRAKLLYSPTLCRYSGMLKGSACINAHDGSCHHREIDLIDQSITTSGLSFVTGDVLFDFFETAFLLPPPL